MYCSLSDKQWQKLHEKYLTIQTSLILNNNTKLLRSRRTSVPGCISICLTVFMRMQMLGKSIQLQPIETHLFIVHGCCEIVFYSFPQGGYGAVVTQWAKFNSGAFSKN